MTSVSSSNWLRVLVLVLLVAAVGLPINRLTDYAPLAIAAVLIYCGVLTLRLRNWLAAAAVAVVVALLPLVLSPAPIAEGENVFLPVKPGNVFERQLPPDVYRFMKDEFDALYPPGVRCAPKSEGCWQDGKVPDRLYAFSADGALQRPEFSRSLTSIDFNNPVWLRLGFVNDVGYNWYTGAPDVHRADRNKKIWMGLDRWRITMPWFMMLRFPSDYAGAHLCWRGDVIWPGAEDRYTPIRHTDMACRDISQHDIGRQIFAVSIQPNTLAVKLDAPGSIDARLFVMTAARWLAVIAVLVLLVRVRLRDTARPFTLIVLALMVIAMIDAGFIGGWRPMDGGDDGLAYTGFGRIILQHLIHGNIVDALIGVERVYFYGGPGIRYFRALEMIVFGDTNLGYLSLVLLFPILVLALFKRFLSDAFAWRIALIFTATPAGAIFGSSFFHYAKWSSYGFADPIAVIFMIWGAWVLIGPGSGAPRDMGSAAGAGLLFALAIFMKPIVAPMPGILLGGAGIAALAGGQWRRLAGMCVGFLPVLVMPLHNWIFGHVFVLFSSNSHLPGTYVMAPSDYAAALLELLRLNLAGEQLHRAISQIGDWLTGSGELRATIPLHAVAVAVVVYVVVRGREIDPWVRLIGAAVMAEYVVDLIYAATARYYFGMWLLTALVVCVAVERWLPAWLQSHGWRRTDGALERILAYRSAQAS
ncbi:MAG TPA: hypothetical protein VIJ52_05480 [Pseudolabrys sp.]|nr:hypothetical protein [Pseudolabrys sp.]